MREAYSRHSFIHSFIHPSIHPSIHAFIDLLTPIYFSYLPSNTFIRTHTHIQVYQNISRECPHRSERTEPFTMLTAEVKNKSSLEDSLELYVTGELLAGDNKYACR